MVPGVILFAPDRVSGTKPSNGITIARRTGLNSNITGGVISVPPIVSIPNSVTGVIDRSNAMAFPGISSA
jgi:hypothetical protein